MMMIMKKKKKKWKNSLKQDFFFTFFLFFFFSSCFSLWCENCKVIQGKRCQRLIVDCITWLTLDYHHHSVVVVGCCFCFLLSFFFTLAWWWSSWSEVTQLYIVIQEWFNYNNLTCLTSKCDDLSLTISKFTGTTFDIQRLIHNNKKRVNFKGMSFNQIAPRLFGYLVKLFKTL